jgi:hypothetical protein
MAILISVWKDNEGMPYGIYLITQMILQIFKMLNGLLPNKKEINLLRRTKMKVAELILMLEKYNANAEVSVNCPDTNKTRDIWYVQQDDDPEHSNNFIDIVLTKENENDD